jgi:hypothetical protein
MVLLLCQYTYLVFSFRLVDCQSLLAHLWRKGYVHPPTVFVNHLVKLDASLYNKLT